MSSLVSLLIGIGLAIVPAGPGDAAVATRCWAAESPSHSEAKRADRQPLHRHARFAGTALAQSRPPRATPAPSPDPPAADPEADAAAEGAETALLRHRARITRRHRPLGIATWLSMAGTVALGTMAAINRPTLLGPGMCNSADGYSVLGDFGCNGGLNGAHQISALFTIGLYTTTAVYAMSMPDPEHASVGQDRRGSTLRLHRGMAYIHFIGMLLTPILGVISVIPGLVGAPASVQADVAAAMRTVHLGVGYVTFLALTVAMALEF